MGGGAGSDDKRDAPGLTNDTPAGMSLFAHHHANESCGGWHSYFVPSDRHSILCAGAPPYVAMRLGFGNGRPFLDLFHCLSGQTRGAPTGRVVPYRRSASTTASHCPALRSPALYTTSHRRPTPCACVLWCTPCDLLLTAPNTSCSRHLRRGRRGPGASGGGGWGRRLGGNGLRGGGGGVGGGEPYSGGRAARDEFGVLREDCLEGAISLPFLGLSLLLVATSLPRCLLL